MKKFILLLLFIPFISCSGSDDGYIKANLELTTGCFMNSDGMIITLTKNTYHWNKHRRSSVLGWNLIRSSTDRVYSIKADIDLDIQDGFEAWVEYNPQLKRYRFKRIDKGRYFDGDYLVQYWTKVDCP